MRLTPNWRGFPLHGTATTAAGWRFAIDRGGTFTDVVGFAPDGALHTAKVLSRDPSQPGDPALRGIRAVLDTAGPVHGRRVASVRLGTTVATNALLERAGAATLLVTTAGLADALLIGDQSRPDIFARSIRRPPPLYARVCAVPERIDAAGAVLTPLDEDALGRALEEARRDGIASVAIVFLHGFRHPHHERRAAAIARERGFTEVVASHEAAPLLGYVARGDTTVADAYLSPVLWRYTREFRANLERELDCADVTFMQSNGGLVDAAGFRGVNGVLSGPAGGVVGMIAAGTRDAPRRLLGFDMGGTSTDVSLSTGGAIPRRFATEIDGVRLRAPLVDVATIAAGGGSILRFADGRLQVGPASAGADPGPACYRRQGPATVTDCNVALGRIPPERFPRVFGPHGDAPIDPDAARERLRELAATARAGTGVSYTVEALAEAFLEVAVARMANAIRELALHHGEDPTRFALLSFGGAAGQHACAVADRLGVDEVLLHPLAGVLSAYGIALTSRRAIRRTTHERVLDDDPAAADEVLETLAIDARDELLRQGVPAAQVAVNRTAHLRLPGADSTIELPWSEPHALRAAFVAAHRQLYGFADERVAPVVATLQVETVEQAPATDGGSMGVAALDSGGTSTAGTTAVWYEGGWHEVSLLDRATLASGATLQGPCLLCEDGATSWIAPGWHGAVTASGLLVLRRAAPMHGASDTQQDPGTGRHEDTGAATPDPMRLEVFNALFMHVAEQMGAVLRQTASSVNIKERLDFSCALFDGAANLVANAPHMPVHLGSMGASVAAVLERFGDDLRPGDACLLNSPYAGGTHLPDITVVSPVFDATGRVVEFFTASRAHHADVGGVTPGSMPPHSRSIAEEGALIEPHRIVRDGELDEALLERLLSGGPHPARNLEQNFADLRAQLAANARGARELGRAFVMHGRRTLLDYMGHVQDNAEACMRRAIRRLRPGSFRYELDNGQSIAVRIDVDVARGAAVVDFTGTSPQQDNNFNAPRAVTVAAVLYVFRTLIDEPIPLNAGCLRPLTIVVPGGSMLDPVAPAAVVAGNVETSQCIVDALYGALGLQAASQGTMNNFTFGNERYQYYETIAGGSGAGPDYDGASGVQTHMTNSRLTDPEVLETRFPVLLREFSIRRGSGGAGAHRGGDGVVRRLEFREPMTVAILSNHRRVAPFGLAGGAPARTGRNTLWRAGAPASESLAATDGVAVDPGDQVQVETPGGGGYGVERT
ncbi:MAG TPA: hydantoinase B/oxoprolinase family protein [Steroidobacteraceae bacterium]|nr:hydantoinase B/oxoprolinase family protein [Steroidobacteraceae bacterium]